MHLFVKAAEVWQLDPASNSLQLSSSEYGRLTGFKNVSVDMRFAYGEGLPGQTWEKGCPLIWTNLNHMLFKRAEAAKAAGITCGVSMPVFVGDFLQSVVVLFLGTSEHVSGVVEVWANIPFSDTELNLLEWYYGELKQFEWISKRLTIMRGSGLPGMAWQQAKPIIIPDLGNASTFLRARNAAESGISTGLAVPFLHQDPKVQILTFLSAKGTPIARRFEIWTCDNERNELRFDDGHCSTGNDLQQKYQHVVINKGEGLFGQVWATGKPVIAPTEGEKGSSVLFPVIHGGRFISLVVFVL